MFDYLYENLWIVIAIIITALAVFLIYDQWDYLSAIGRDISDLAQPSVKQP